MFKCSLKDYIAHVSVLIQYFFPHLQQVLFRQIISNFITAQEQQDVAQSELKMPLTQPHNYHILKFVINLDS